MRFPISFLAAAILAGPISLLGNPTILIKDPPPPAIIVGDSFGFGADALGGGVLSFQNGSGSDWRDLLVTVTLPPNPNGNAQTITVGPGPFQTDTLTITPVTGGFFYDILFGPTATGGIPNGQTFTINLNNSGSDPNGAGDWGAGRDFGAQANIPEPSAGMLLLAGGLFAAGFIGYRRRTA